MQLIKRSFIFCFVENGTPGVSSLTCVIVSALCSLNKRYIIMEGAAAGTLALQSHWLAVASPCYRCMQFGAAYIYIDTCKYVLGSGHFKAVVFKQWERFQLIF